MVTIGVDPHKQTHTELRLICSAVSSTARPHPLGVTDSAPLLAWAKSLDSERVWVIEDCRHVSGALERFLLDFGEAVVRLSPALMAGARRSVRERREVRSDRRARGRAGSAARRD